MAYQNIYETTNNFIFNTPEKVKTILINIIVLIITITHQKICKPMKYFDHIYFVTNLIKHKKYLLGEFRLNIQEHFLLTE